jgi:ABC-type glycerol-3-phosphate transport system substrate-binding protein
MWSLSIVVILLVTMIIGCAPAAPVEPQIITQIVEVPKEVIVEVTPTPEPLGEGAKVVIRVGSGDSGEGLNPHQEIIANFEKENPDIIVQLEAVAGNDYYTRLLTQIAAGDAPDIMQIGDDAVPMFVSKGAFLPLDDFINGTYPLDTSVYMPGLLVPGQYQGKQYFLTKDFSTLAVYYNKKIFDQYKVAYPTDDWTWQDFLDTAQKLTIDENADGTPEVSVAFGEFIVYGVARPAGTGSCGVSSLNHEAVYDPVEYHAIVESFLYQLLEVSGSLGHIIIKLDGDVAHAGLQEDSARCGLLFGGEAACCQQNQGDNG